MVIIEGDLSGSPVFIINSRAGTTLEVRARLMTVKSYRIPKDLKTIEVLSERQYHTLEQWLLMVLLSITVIGLLISVPMYLFAKKTQFKARINPKHDKAFVIEGDKSDWKQLKPFI